MCSSWTAGGSPATTASSDKDLGATPRGRAHPSALHPSSNVPARNRTWSSTFAESRAILHTPRTFSFVGQADFGELSRVASLPSLTSRGTRLPSALQQLQMASWQLALR